MEEKGKVPLRVAIRGSGLTGLLIAQGLRKNGIQAVVYERDPCLDHRVRDWTLMIHWGLDALQELIPEDVLLSLPQAYCDPFYPHKLPTESIPCFHGETGDVLYTIPATEMRRVSRQRCRRVLSQGLDIQFSKRLANILDAENDSVTLVFENGANEEADIVIGADGPSSKTREILLGAELAAVNRTPWVVAMSTFSYHDAFKARFTRSPHPMWTMSYDPTGICAVAVQEVKSADEPGDWEFTLIRLWKGDTSGLDGKAALDEVKRRSGHLCEPFGSAVRWIPEGSSCNTNQLRYWIPVPWNNRKGRVTLAGDAAHASLPFRGQGFNVTMDDAKRIINSVVEINKGASREELMRAYDSDVVKRGREAVMSALEEGTKAMDFNLSETKAVKMGLARPSVQGVVSSDF